LNPVVDQREELPILPFGNLTGFVPAASRGIAQYFIIKRFKALAWRHNHTRKLPKDQRIVTAKRVEEAVLGFHDSLSGLLRLVKKLHCSWTWTIALNI